MAFVDIGVGTAMLYGAGIGAAAGGIYAGVTGKNVLNGALIGGAGGALLGTGAAALGATAGAGATVSEMATADAASMAGQGLTTAQISSTLAASYPELTAAQADAAAAAATGGSSAAATGATAANAANAANQAGNSSTAAGTSNAATNVAKNAMITPPPPPPSSSLIPGISNSNLLGYGIPAAMVAYSTGMFGNNVNNQGITQQSTVGQSQPNPNIRGLSPNYQSSYPQSLMAAEGGIMKLAAGGAGESSMTPDVTQSVYNPADVNAAKTNSLSPQTQSLLNQYGINSTQATNALSALQSQGIGSTKTAAEGGIMGLKHGGETGYNLGSYSDGGRLLKGPGDGMSDEIPATIAHKQPARLAEGEFVVPADVVSHLGNGSTDAGAKHLYKMMDNVRKARTGKPKQAKQIKADKYLPK